MGGRKYGLFVGRYSLGGLDPRQPLQSACALTMKLPSPSSSGSLPVVFRKSGAMRSPIFHTSADCCSLACTFFERAWIAAMVMIPAAHTVNVALTMRSKPICHLLRRSDFLR